MRELSITNIEYLKREISNTGLTYSHLQDDMIDHVCCDVEYEMQSGLPFEKAYEMVKEKIGFGGLIRVQEDTLFLIDKNYRTMKKLMKISGVIAPVIIALGTIFKIEHWPGAGIILVLGFFALGFLFLPSTVYVTYEEVSNKSMKFAHISGFLSAFFIFISFGFKIMHWPGTPIMLLTGVVIACVFFLPVLLVNKLKDTSITKPRSLYILGFIGFIFYLFGFMFKVQHWPGATILLLAGALLLVFITFPWYAYLKFKNQQMVTSNFIFMVIALIWFIVPTMLLSLNVSYNIFHGFEQFEYASTSHIKTLDINSDKLYNKLSASDANKQNVILIKQNIDLLASFIYQLKVEVVKAADKENATYCFSSDGQILINRIDNKSATEPVKVALFGQEKRVFQLKDKMKAIRGQLLKDQNNSKLKEIIKMGFTADLDDNNWEIKTFDKIITVNALNLLSEIEEGVRIAENAWLLEQDKKSGSTTVPVNNNQQKL
jgi:hypothetical protein